jgi:hypothetical protein
MPKEIKNDIEDDDDGFDIEIVEDDADVDDSTPGDGINLNDDLYDKSKNIPVSDDDDSDEGDDPDEEERKQMGRRAQKRIKQLLAKQKELESQLAERDTKLDKIVKDSSKRELSEYERSVEWFNNREKELDDFEKTIATSYRSARQNDDIEAEWAAQKALQQVNAERTAIRSRKEQFQSVLDSRKGAADDDFAQRQDRSDDGYVVDQGGQQVAQTPQPDPKAIDWWKRNPWFHGSTNEERIMTASALQINQELLEEGYDPNNDPDDYYKALDRRISQEFPQLSKGSRKMKDSPVSGGGRAGPRKGGKQRVKLTPSMVARAERLGLTKEQYAAEVQKLRDKGRDI